MVKHSGYFIEFKDIDIERNFNLCLEDLENSYIRYNELLDNDKPEEANIVLDSIDGMSAVLKRLFYVTLKETDKWDEDAKVYKITSVQVLSNTKLVATLKLDLIKR